MESVGGSDSDQLDQSGQSSTDLIISSGESAPYLISVVDIFAVCVTMLMLMMAILGFCNAPAAPGMLSYSTILNIILTVATLSFQSYFMREAIARINRGLNKTGFLPKFDNLASVHPILSTMFFMLVPMSLMISFNSGPIFIVANMLILTAGLLLVALPGLRWLFLTATLGYRGSHLPGPDGHTTFNKGAAIAGGVASAAMLLTIFGPSLISVGWWNPLCLMVTTLSFVFLRNCMIQSNPLVQLSAEPVKPSTALIEAEGDVQIKYNHFVEVQKWFKQRMHLGSHWKLGIAIFLFVTFLIAMYLQVPNLLLATFAAILKPVLGNGFGGVGGGHDNVLGDVTATAVANQVLITTLASSAAALSSGLLLAFVRAPKKLSAGKSGIKLLFSGASGKAPLRLDWSQIKHIKVERPAGKTSAASDRLVFERYKGTPVVLKLAGIASADDREKLLGAIDRFAPEISREAAIEETLRRPMEQNYTELWLQALAAPPKREKLKPLVQDAVLSDDRYLVKKELGVGGQGFAYLAQDKRKDKEVVLKEFVLPVFVDINARRQSLESFEKEAKLLSSLDHPQVVKLEGFFVEDHRAYLVLEHIDGQNLRQIVERDGPMSEEKIKALAKQMCSILQYLHNLSPPLVHRDFTPDNLILNKDGTLKLIDFNVAQQVAYATTGTVVGKQAYLPPEQFRGQAVPSSDLYAFGATLYYLAGGKDPTPISVAKPKKDGLNVSDELDHLISSLTQMEAQARPANARAVEEILNSIGQESGQNSGREPGSESRQEIGLESESHTIKIKTAEAEPIVAKAAE